MINMIALAGFLLFIGCAQPMKERETKVSMDEINKVQLSESYQLMKNNCFTCHNPNAVSHDDILAPPMVAIKIRYLRKYPNKESFVNAMTNFIENPSSQAAIMRGAVLEFDVMPKVSLDRRALEDISDYIYENQLEEPEWFAEHFKEMHGERLRPRN